MQPDDLAVPVFRSFHETEGRDQSLTGRGESGDGFAAIRALGYL